MLYSFRLIGPVAFCIDKLEDAEELKVWKTCFVLPNILVALVKRYRLQWLQMQQ